MERGTRGVEKPADRQATDIRRCGARLLKLLRLEAQAVGLFPYDRDDPSNWTQKATPNTPNASTHGSLPDKGQRVDWGETLANLPTDFSAATVVGLTGKPIEQIYAAVSRWKRAGLIEKTDDGYRKVKWIPLPELDLGEIPGWKPHTVKLRTGVPILIRSWRGLLTEIAEWLVLSGKITRDQCPIRIGKAENAFIDKGPIFHEKKDSGRQAELSNSFFLNVHYSSVRCVRMAVNLLERYGENPSGVSVQLA